MRVVCDATQAFIKRCNVLSAIIEMADIREEPLAVTEPWMLMSHTLAGSVCVCVCSSSSSSSSSRLRNLLL